MNHELLAKLSNGFGPSGFEEPLAKIIVAQLNSLGCHYKRDNLGNVIVRLNPQVQNKPIVLFDAHMDEVGLMVRHITPEGFLQVTEMGGVNPNTLIAKLLKLYIDDDRYVYGVTATVPPHLKERKEDHNITVNDLYIDIGTTNSDQVTELGVRIGTPAVADFEFRHLHEKRFIGKALDDRIGCCLLLETITSLIQSGSVPQDYQLCFSFSVQEEVGLRGVAAIVEELNPDLFFATEGTVCADIPQVKSCDKTTSLDGGPALTVMDRSVITPRFLIDGVLKIANHAKIPYQIKTPAVGGTNSGAVHKLKKGIPSLSMATPCRYIHTNASVVSSNDYDNGKLLISEIIRNMYPEILANLPKFK